MVFLAIVLILAVALLVGLSFGVRMFVVIAFLRAASEISWDWYKRLGLCQRITLQLRTQAAGQRNSNRPPYLVLPAAPPPHSGAGRPAHRDLHTVAITKYRP